MSTPSTLVAGRYRLVKLLGSGGMGNVWQAWDERLQRSVALKMLRTQPVPSAAEHEMATKRAMREARITAGLHHPHAVTVFDVVEHEGQPCIVMQLIDSTPLSVLLREHGTFTPWQTAEVGAQVGSALAAAHKLRIVHRDVKPGNILITDDGSAMISDFGISHALGDATITATGMMHGTPAYLAPEVAQGRPSSFASDVFSLGSTLYAMLQGAPPFGSDDNAIALLHKVARGNFVTPKHAGVLAPLLREMMAIDPKRRPKMSTIASRLAELSERADGPEASVLPAAAPGHATAPAVAATGAAAAGAAEKRPATSTGETRRIGDTAETEQLAAMSTDTHRPAQPTAPTERLVEPAAATKRLVEPAAATERIVEPVTDAEHVAPPTTDAERPAATAAPPSLSWLVQGPPGAPPEGPPVHAGRRPERRRAAVVIGSLLLVGILVLGGVLLFSSLRPDGDESGGPEAGAAPTTAAATPRPSPSEDAQPPPVEPDDGGQAEEAPPPPSAEERIVQAVTSYYGLLPDDLDSAWLLMTADYQENHVGGRDAYGAFWGDVADVSVSDVTATAPDGAQATLTYAFNDGSVVQEVTAYRLVDEGGVLKIAATTVLSSVGL